MVFQNSCHCYRCWDQMSLTLPVLFPESINTLHVVRTVSTKAQNNEPETCKILEQSGEIQCVFSPFSFHVKIFYQILTLWKCGVHMWHGWELPERSDPLPNWSQAEWPSFMIILRGTVGFIWTARCWHSHFLRAKAMCPGSQLQKCTICLVTLWLDTLFVEPERYSPTICQPGRPSFSFNRSL